MENPDAHSESDRSQDWLRAQAERIGCDADVIAAMPIEEVREELHAEGADREEFLATAAEQLYASDAEQESYVHEDVGGEIPGVWGFPQMLVRVATIATAALVLYGALWVTGRAMQPETVSLAQIGESRDFESQFASRASEVKNARGGASFWAQAAEGTSYLNNARGTTLGLFPYYDQETVEQGIEHLQAAFTASEVQPQNAAALDMQEERQIQRARMALLIAKGYLMLEEVDLANEWLERTQQLDDGELEREATKILEQIDAMKNND